MDRVNRILKHKLYLEQYQVIEREEENRIYCRHTLEHFLDVARLMYIKNLEDHLGFSRDIIYGAALLHDIGRGLQYLEQIPHEEGSLQIAEKILPECGYSREESEEILQAIGEHRCKDKTGEMILGNLLKEADQKSRLCFICKARETCHWPEEKKNRGI